MLKQLMASSAFIAIAIMASASTNLAQAQYTGPNETPTYQNVASILKNPVNDTPVTLRGKLVKQSNHKMYQFNDGTGTINAKISPKQFAGQKVSPDTRIEIYGEVETSRNKPVKIDVKHLRIVDGK